MAKRLRAEKRQYLAKSNPASASPIGIEAMEPRVLLSSVAYSYVTDQSVYSVGAGKTAIVKVYLEETLNGNSSIIDANGENGLLGAGFEATTAAQAASPALITAINPDTTDFSGLYLPNVDNPDLAAANPNEADLTEAIGITANTGVQLGNSSAPADEIYLGSLTVTGGAAAGTTTYNVGAYDVSGTIGGNTITNPDDYDMDVGGSVNGIAYTSAASTTFSIVTTGGSVSLPTPTVSVTSGNAVYNGLAYAPTATVGGSSGSDAKATKTYAYYSGSSATGTQLAGAPKAVGTYTVVANFAGDTIYAGAKSTPKTFAITAKPLTATVTVSNKTYNGTTAATIASRTLSGVISGDTVSCVGGTATFASAGPGTGIVVNVTGLSLTGTNASDYTVNSTATTKANITAASASVITAHAATLQGQEGRIATGTVATFTDSKTALLANSFSATIAWGDGKTSAGTVVRTAAGAFTVTGSHEYANEKPAGYAVTVSIHGSDGSSGVANSLAKIVDSPLDTGVGLTFNADVNVSFTSEHLATFRDQDSLNTNHADYTGTISWGDGATSAANFVFSHSVSNVGSYWIVEGSHKYTTKKTYSVTITLHDNDSPTKPLVIKAICHVISPA